MNSNHNVNLKICLHLFIQVQNQMRSLPGKHFNLSLHSNMVNINSGTFNLINTYLALTSKTYNTGCSKEVKTKE